MLSHSLDPGPIGPGPNWLICEDKALADVVDEDEGLENKLSVRIFNAYDRTGIQYQKHAETPEDGTDETECLDRFPSLARVIVVAIWVAKKVHEQAEGHEPEDHHDEVPEIVDDRDSEWDKEDEGRKEGDTGDHQSINNPPVRVGRGIGVAVLVLEPCRESDDDLRSGLACCTKSDTDCRLTAAQKAWQARRNMLRRREPSMLTVFCFLYLTRELNVMTT